jgi:hypothetical protein
VRRRHFHHLACSLGILMLLAGMQPGDWSMTDETTVDLERAPAARATQYQRPRGARQYRYDETEVDLATPLPVPETLQAAPDPVPDDGPDTIPAPEEELPR